MGDNSDYFENDLKVLQYIRCINSYDFPRDYFTIYPVENDSLPIVENKYSMPNTHQPPQPHSFTEMRLNVLAPFHSLPSALSAHIPRGSSGVWNPAYDVRAPGKI